MTRFYKSVFIVTALITAMMLPGMVRAQTQTLADDGQLKLKGNITIKSDIVRLGDLFKNAAAYADIAVFRAPAPGKTGYLSTRRIAEAASKKGLEWSNPLKIRDVVVSRAGKPVPMNNVRALIEARIVKSIGEENLKYQLALANGSTNLIIPAHLEPKAEILQFSFNRASGRFSVVIAAPAGKPQHWRKTYNGRAFQVIELPVLTRPLKRGEIISKNDIKLIKLPKKRVRRAIITDAADLIGLAVRRPLGAGRQLREADLERPKLVRKNSLVFITYNDGALRISTRVRALNDGALGEAITVLNPKSRRRFQATVSGSGQARVIAHSHHTKTARLVK